MIGPVVQKTGRPDRDRHGAGPAHDVGAQAHKAG